MNEAEYRVHLKQEIENRIEKAIATPKYKKLHTSRAEVARSMYGDRNLPLYHGVRSSSKEKIKNEGLSSFTLDCAINEIYISLKYFRFDELEEDHSYAKRQIELMINDLKLQRRLTIWATTHEGEACWWAENNPEFITVILEDIDIPKDKIYSYLEERFGKPYSIKLVYTYPRNDNDVSTKLTYIPPEDIIWIKECP